MNSLQNQNTQPLRKMEVFNNWDVVAKGWYIVCHSKEIRQCEAKSFTICGQKIA